MRKVFVSPSILSADFARLEQECKSLQKSGADWIHCDVMDGVFVPNMTFGMPIVSSIRKCVVLPLDVHLMITEPKRYVEQFAKAGADIITFHVEATKDVVGTIELIKKCGKKVGLSIKPNTGIETLLPYKGMFDVLLIMSVEPGFGGQTFIPSSLQKIAKARELFPDVLIEVDGGINLSNCAKVVQAGADVLVAGNAIIYAENRQDAIAQLKQG